MSHNDIDRFEEQWREWSRRAPRTAPADAARQVLARLDETRRGERRRATERPVRRRFAAPWLAAAAVLLVMLGVGVFRPFTSPAPAIDLAEPPPLGEDVVLIWLDTETPLYMSLRPTGTQSRTEKGNTP